MISKVRNDKVVSLQGLRGYACLLVFISHCYFAVEADIVGSDVTGAFGVSVFIMLSGYLLIFNAPGRNEQPLKKRLLSKIKKFYPLHILSLIAATPFNIYSILKGTAFWHTEIFKFITNALLLQSWIPDKNFYFSFNTVSWYLSITIFFIIISPLIIKLCYKAAEHNLLLVSVAAYAVQFLIFVVFRNTEFSNWIIYICPITRSIDFFLGGMTALIVKKYSKNLSYRLQNILFLSALCCCDVFLILAAMTSKNCFFYVCAWTIPSMVIIGISGGYNCSKLINIIFENKAIVFIGNISFELFLIHQLVIRYLSKSFEFIGFNGNEWYLSILEFLVSVLAAVIYRKLFKMLKK